MKVFVTGSSGLTGSEAVLLRREFFGPAGDTTRNLELPRKTARRFTHPALDIRDREKNPSRLHQRFPKLRAHYSDRRLTASPDRILKNRVLD